MPRKYVSKRRASAQNETRRKIVEAVVELHAEKGVLGTTYADVARRADVAIPTVYKHFPTRAELVQGCTAHVAAAAPAFGVEIFTGIEAANKRLHALTRSAFRSNAYFSRWVNWGETKQVPELQQVHAESRKHLEMLIRAACAPFRMKQLDAFVAVALTLLSAASWENLRFEQKLTQAASVELVARALSAAFRDFSQ